MVKAYWNVGREIVEKQGGASRAAYGDGLMKSLAARLTVEFGEGFTASNLFNMILAVDPNAATNPIPTPPPAGGGDNSGNTGGDNNDSGNNNQGSTTIPVGSYTHNVTEQGTAGDFFTLSGSLSSSKGDVSYAGLTLTQCLKLSSSASVRFTAPADGKVTLVFNSSCAGYTVKINGGDAIAIPSDGLLGFDVLANTSYEVTKGKSESFLYYLVYTPEDAHTHSYSAAEIDPDCLTDVLVTYTCDCGDSYTETIPAAGHDFVDGFCTNCGADDPDYTDDNDDPIVTPDDKFEDDTEQTPDNKDETPDDETETPENPDDNQPEVKLNFFQRIWKAIADFFRRLFGKKD